MPKRITAIKTDIKSITEGKYVDSEGYSPSHVITNYGQKVSRVRVLSTVVTKFVSETGKFASLTLDDGTDTIRAKTFKDLSKFEHVNIGDVVDVVGKIRKYNNEVYVLAESVNKVNDPNWETLRILEIKELKKSLQKNKELVLQYKEKYSGQDLKRILKEEHKIPETFVDSVIKIAKEVKEDTKKSTEQQAKEKILEIIEKNDKGDGCDYSIILERSGLEEDIIDSIINELLSDGICFEPRPGKIRKL
jgi:RPA family protein